MHHSVHGSARNDKPGFVRLAKKGEWVCKPSSVSLTRFSCGMTAICLDRLLPAGSPETSGCDLPAVNARAGHPAYLVLQAVGFTMPASSPTPRCALTAPFHHCLFPEELGSSAVCFLRHFPWGRPRWSLSTTAPFPARTFLLSLTKPAAVRPTLLN